MPKIETRPEQAYVGKRAIMPMSDFETKVPELTAEVSKWLDQNGVEATGKPLLRYHVVDMPDRMDVELAIPVKSVPHAVAGIDHGTLPAGRYATSTFTGVRNGIPANKKLIDWIADQGEEMVVHKSENGDVFKSRYETILTDAKAEPDQDKWETEIAIKVRD
jgi:effector-binding domain-containing protein